MLISQFLAQKALINFSVIRAIIIMPWERLGKRPFYRTKVITTN